MLTEFKVHARDARQVRDSLSSQWGELDMNSCRRPHPIQRMPRFLTPARLCLLALIDIYVSDQTPATARLNLLDFIAAHISTAVNDHHGELKSIAETRQDASSLLAPLGTSQSQVPGRSILDVCLNALWSMQSLDHLQLLFDKVALLTTDLARPGTDDKQTKVSRASPIGQFIRRCCVEWTRQQFAESESLWSSFARYKESTYDLWAQRNPDASKELEELAEARFALYVGGSAHKPALASSEDIDSLLAASIQQLQKLGTRVPEDLQQRLQEWMSDQRDSESSSLQHFLAFFDHWRAGQYTMALESIHRYFDYSLTAKDNSSDNVKIYYQYALLHLSVLHADFCCWDESVDAMNECIATGEPHLHLTFVSVLGSDHE